MEQIFIYELLDFINRSGGQEFINELIYETNEDNNPRLWTEDELDKATTYLHTVNTNFGRDSALQIIKTLQAKYRLSAADLSSCAAETEKLAANEEL